MYISITSIVVEHDRHIGWWMNESEIGLRRLDPPFGFFFIGAAAKKPKQLGCSSKIKKAASRFERDDKSIIPSEAEDDAGIFSHPSKPRRRQPT